MILVRLFFKDLMYVRVISIGLPNYKIRAMFEIVKTTLNSHTNPVVCSIIALLLMK